MPVETSSDVDEESVLTASSEETLSDFSEDEEPNDGRPPMDSYLELGPDTVLHEHYTIIKLLGAGRNSMVYLARDTSVEGSPLRAIKILTARATSFEFDEGETSYELEVLKIIGDATRRRPDDPGHQHVLKFFDHFTIASPYGDHLAFVINVLGHHVGQLQARIPNRSLLPVVARNICQQLLQALAFLHEECKVVHTDIKQDNVILDDFGATETDLLSVSVSLADFGEAVPEHGDREKVIQPVTLRSPESIVGLKWDTKADIWNLGCFMFELLAGTRLFVAQETRNEDGGIFVSKSQFHFAHIFAYLRFPHETEQVIGEYFSRGRVAAEIFTSDGEIRVQISNQMSLEEILRHYEIYTPELLDFLWSMLRILPHDRLSARELLSHPWLHMVEPLSEQPAQPSIDRKVQDTDSAVNSNDSE